MLQMRQMSQRAQLDETNRQIARLEIIKEGMLGRLKQTAIDITEAERARNDSRK